MSCLSCIEYSYTTSRGDIVEGSVYEDYWANVESDYRKRLTRILGYGENSDSVESEDESEEEAVEEEVVMNQEVFVDEEVPVPQQTNISNEKLKRKASCLSLAITSFEGADLNLPASTQSQSHGLSSEERARIIIQTLSPKFQNRAHASQFYASLQPSPAALSDPKYGGSGKRMDVKQRREYLDADEWCMDILAETVVCRACRKTLALEQVKASAKAVMKKEPKNREYYSSQWLKHRNRCKKIYRQWCENNGLEPSSV